MKEEGGGSKGWGRGSKGRGRGSMLGRRMRK